MACRQLVERKILVVKVEDRKSCSARAWVEREIDRAEGGPVDSCRP